MNNLPLLAAMVAVIVATVIGIVKLS